MTSDPRVPAEPTEVVSEIKQGALLVCLFHLNLAYSSLEAEDRSGIVERCYRPLLGLAEATGFPIAIEASGWTFERIAELDPGWIAECRDLLAEGRMEIVGSSYTQCAAPLVPADVNRWNIRLGREVYAELLGVEPRIALVPEQAYSAGVATLYAEAGYEAIVADWDNAYRSHQDWPDSHRRFPQLAVGVRGEIPVIWSESIAFQRFQRYAHGELSLREYLAFVRGICEPGDGALLLYANDAEVFDHRPGRFAAEPTLEEAEWDRIAAGLAAIRDEALGAPGFPSAALGLLEHLGAGNKIHLETPDQPVPVKKQDKYNIGRWAVTGRDDSSVNTRCYRIYERMRAEGCDDNPDAWRRLCALWSSDVRTHITEARWMRYLEELERAECDWRVSATNTTPALATIERSPESDGYLYTLRHGDLTLVVNARRGLAVHAFTDASVADVPLFGTIPHGYFETIDLGADWYSGSLVQEAPLRHKIADLNRVTPELGLLADGKPAATAVVPTELGEVVKTVVLDGDAHAVDIHYAIGWDEIPRGSLRLGYVTLLPEAFSAAQLWFATHNGGDAVTRFELADSADFDHGAPVSAIVSSRQGLGVTEGVVLIGDDRHALAIGVDQLLSKPLGLVSFRVARPGHLTRVCFSIAEEDDTRRGPIALATSREFRVSVSARRAPER